MRKVVLIMSLLFTAVSFGKSEVPSPSVFLSISEKILTEAHHFVFPDDKETIKLTPKVKSELKNKVTSPKKTEPQSLWNTDFKIRFEGMWIVSE